MFFLTTLTLVVFIEKMPKNGFIFFKCDTFKSVTVFMKFYFLSYFLLFASVVFGQDQIAAQWLAYTSSEKSTTQTISKQEIQTSNLLVRFIEPIAKASLQKEHIHILRVLDTHHAIIRLDKNAEGLVKKTYEIFPANDLWKLSDLAFSSNDTERLLFTLRSAEVDKTLKALENTNSIKVIARYHNTIYFETTLTTIKKEILALPEVNYIGIESMTPHLESTVRDLNPAINNINKVYKAFSSLEASEITISLKDNRFITTDIDLTNKLVTSPLIATTVDMHATDMSTIIAGRGNSSIKGKGVLPEAKIQLSDFLSLTPDGATFLSDQQIYIQNHSYGTDIENFYGSLAAAYDHQVFQNPNELHVFSSGNNGETIPTNGIYKDIGSYGNLTGNFKMAKNILTVGAMNEEKGVMNFSSKGPAYDGRIKPELVAYSIIGTSNATALTSGVAGLLEQLHLDLYASVPTAAILKAVLINGADDIHTKGPDYASGYGAVNAFKAAKILEELHFIEDAVGFNETKTFDIVIPENAKNFKATLVWTDMPAPENSNSALINDLNFEIISSSTTFLPWVLETTPNVAALEAPAQKGEDHINNIEQISIDAPPEGILQLQVTGFDVVSPTQDFAIAYSWETTNSFEWNYPLANDNFPYDGETASYFRWESNFDVAEGVLSISYDNGSSWENINSEALLEDGYFLWTAPENLNTEALVKMTIGTDEYISEPFIISSALSVTVGLDCNDTVQLGWNSKENVSAYNIYNLGENGMELSATTIDTTFVFDKSSINSNYFAVAPILTDGNMGVRSPTIDYEVFDAGCYQSDLIAQLSADKKAGELLITLFSIFEVASIKIERKAGDTYQTIAEISDPQSLNITYRDQNPSQGLNTYRIQMVLEDGTEFASEDAEFFFLTTVPFATFPNPVEDGITVFTSDFSDQEVWLEVFSLDGRLIMKKPIPTDQEFVFLDFLRQGIYAISIYANSGERLEKLIYKL